MPKIGPEKNPDFFASWQIALHFIAAGRRGEGWWSSDKKMPALLACVFCAHADWHGGSRKKSLPCSCWYFGALQKLSSDGRGRGRRKRESHRGGRGRERRKRESHKNVSRAHRRREAPPRARPEGARAALARARFSKF